MIRLPINCGFLIFAFLFSVFISACFESQKTPSKEKQFSTTGNLSQSEKSNSLKSGKSFDSKSCKDKNFEQLLEKNKKIAYYFYLALVNIESLKISQDKMFTLVRRMLLGIMSVQKKIPHKLRRKIKKYTREFLENSGNTFLNSGRKFYPTFIPGELAAAAQIAMNSSVDLGEKNIGVELDANKMAELENLLSVIRPYLFGGKFKDSKYKVDSGIKNAEKIHNLGFTCPLIKNYFNKLNELLDSKSKKVYSLLGNICQPSGYIDFYKEWVNQSLKFEFYTRHESFGTLLAVRDESLHKIAGKVLEKAMEFEFQTPYKVPGRQTSLVYGKVPVVTPVRKILATGVFTKDMFRYLAKKDANDNTLSEKILYFTDKPGEITRFKFAFTLLSDMFFKLWSPMHKKARARETDIDWDTLATVNSYLSALFHAFSDLTFETGIIKNTNEAKKFYNWFFSGLHEDKAMNFIVNMAVKDELVTLKNNGDRRKAVIKDYDKLQKNLGQLTKELRKIISKGENNKAQEFLKTYKSDELKNILKKHGKDLLKSRCYKHTTIELSNKTGKARMVIMDDILKKALHERTLAN